MTRHNEPEHRQQHTSKKPEADKPQRNVAGEDTEPRGGDWSLRTGMTIAVIAVLVFLALLGGWYLWKPAPNFAGDRSQLVVNQGITPDFGNTSDVAVTLGARDALSAAAQNEPPVAAPGPSSQSPATSPTTSPATSPTTPAAAEQLRLGKTVFSTCAACHQFNGQGIPGKYPPLDGNPVVNGREDNVARIVLRGLHGPVEVHGNTFDGQMPSWSQFDDRSLAAVLTYVRASWSNDSPPVSEELVAAVRKATSERKKPWTLAELESMPRIEVKPSAKSPENPSPSAKTLQN